MPVINFSPPCPICREPVPAEVYAWFSEEIDEKNALAENLSGFIDELGNCIEQPWRLVGEDSDDETYLARFAADAMLHATQLH